MTDILAPGCIQCGCPVEAPSDYCGTWPRCVDPAPHTPEFSTMGDGVERAGPRYVGMGWGMTRPPAPPHPAPEADEGNG